MIFVLQKDLETSVEGRVGRTQVRSGSRYSEQREMPRALRSGGESQEAAAG